MEFVRGITKLMAIYKRVNSLIERFRRRIRNSERRCGWPEEKIPGHPVDSSAVPQDGFLGGRSEDLSHYGVEFMSDAQRRDKLPLMNGPTANSWPSFGIRTEKDETGGGESLVLSQPVLGLPSKFPGTFPPPTLIATSFHSNFFVSRSSVSSESSFFSNLFLYINILYISKILKQRIYD